MVGLAGCSSKPRLEPIVLDNKHYAPIYGIIGWVESPTLPFKRADAERLMLQHCTDAGLKLNPLDEVVKGTTTMSFYECNP